MAENPYPPADDYRTRDLERRLDRTEQRLDAMQDLGVLKSELTYIRRDIERLDRKIDDHIADVKPLLDDMAGRRGFSSGIKSYIQYGVIVLILALGAVLNIIVFARGR